jgi:hypothetical protein
MRMRGIGSLNRASFIFSAPTKWPQLRATVTRSNSRKEETMLLNKWVQFGLAALVALLGFASSFDWTALVSPKTAGVIVGTIGVFKMLTNAIAPAPGKTAAATDGTIITHTAS